MFTLVVTAGLCKLSLWQWQRGMEKEAWLGRMAVAQQVAPMTLARIDWGNLESLDGLSLGGEVEWVSPHIWLLDNQAVAGEIGYDIIIPVRAGDARPLLLVNLGWVPA